MAQTAGVLIAWSNRDDTDGKHVYFTTLDKVKFRSPARPGDVLHLDVKCIGGKGCCSSSKVLPVLTARQLPMPIFQP